MKSTTIQLDKLYSADPKIKYGFVRELLKIGAKDPTRYYSQLDRIELLLNNPNNILKWTGIDMIGYISAVDRDHKIEKEIPVLVNLLHSGQLITCNHAVFALGLIAGNKPEKRKTILKELLLIRKDSFKTNECREIATGKVLDALIPFLPELKKSKPAIEFIRQASGSPRNSTRKRAERLLKMLAVQK
ncbi:MAG TPA: hypothetical protein VI583_07865 [Cyclobacteriaceae bacterium]|nr:hypothetical protein [Cyclobacteriaceae bacterium]